MANIAALKNELTTDPLGRGYAGMSDQVATDSLNTVDRQRNKASITGDEIFNAADGGELAALATGSNAQKQAFEMFLALCSRDVIDPFGTANVRLIQEIFGGGSATITALAALRVETVSRAVELGLGDVRESDVFKARS